MHPAGQDPLVHQGKYRVIRGRRVGNQGAQSCDFLIRELGLRVCLSGRPHALIDQRRNGHAILRAVNSVAKQNVQPSNEGLHLVQPKRSAVPRGNLLRQSRHRDYETRAVQDIPRFRQSRCVQDENFRNDQIRSSVQSHRRLKEAHADVRTECPRSKPQLRSAFPKDVQNASFRCASGGSAAGCGCVRRRKALVQTGPLLPFVHMHLGRIRTS
eukprot:scaffold1201_cov247-Pinguiococcus_pyrenoidosus.AAC.6